METKTKAIAGGGGAAAILGGLAAVITSVHGSHSTETTHDTSKDPVVINRPTDAHGNKVPITVIQPSNGGRPIVIVGHGAPGACRPHKHVTASPTPTPTPTASPTSTHTPSKRRC